MSRPIGNQTPQLFQAAYRTHFIEPFVHLISRELLSSQEIAVQAGQIVRRQAERRRPSRLN